MTTTEPKTEFTPAEILAYIPAPFDSCLDDDDINFGNIAVCCAVISAHEPKTSEFNAEMVYKAFQSLVEWAGDYGCKIECDSTGKIVLSVEG